MSKHTTLEQMKLLAQRTKGEISKVESKSLVGVKVNGVALAIADQDGGHSDCFWCYQRHSVCCRQGCCGDGSGGPGLQGSDL